MAGIRTHERLPQADRGRQGVAGPGLEAGEVRKETAIDEIAQIVTRHGPVVVDLATGVLRRSPDAPAKRLVQDELVLSALQRRFSRPVLLQAVQVLEEEEPGGLLGVVKFGRAARLLPQDVVDGFEGGFKHGVGCRSVASVERVSRDRADRMTFPIGSIVTSSMDELEES